MADRKRGKNIHYFSLKSLINYEFNSEYFQNMNSGQGSVSSNNYFTVNFHKFEK